MLVISQATEKATHTRISFGVERIDWQVVVMDEVPNIFVTPIKDGVDGEFVFTTKTVHDDLLVFGEFFEGALSEFWVTSAGLQIYFWAIASTC